MSKTRTTVPLALSTVTGLAAATLMFVMPGEAAPTPTTFAGEATGDVWKVNRLDLDMSGDPVAVGLDVGTVLGQTGSVAAPDRSRAGAHNLNAATQPDGRKSAQSVATASNDTAGTTTASGAAGTVPNVLTFGTSVLSARARWAGDTTCPAPDTALTQSKAASQATGIVPAAIPAGTPPLLPIPVPVEIPTEIPTAPPSEFPTELPTDLPTILPTSTDSTSLPTDLPTTVLPTLTDATSILPTLTDATSILPTLTDATTILPLPRSATSQRADGDVSMVQVAPASIEERTALDAIPGSTTHRRVATEVVGRLVDASKPAASFFGGEATLKMVGSPTLSAYSDGGTNGSQVTWAPPQMWLVVGTDEYPVPTDGTALALPYSQNQDVVLTLSAGKPTTGESATGTQAQAVVTTLNVIIKKGSDLVLDAQLFPMSVKAVAPQGGIDCSLPALKDARLKLTGKDNGPKPDRLKLNAVVDAVGAKARVFKVVHGTRKKVGAGLLDAKGDRRFKIKDTNGKKPTTYLVKIRATALTTADKATKRIR